MPKITIQHTDGEVSRYALEGKLFTVGRAPDNDIVLPDGSSSNYHAVLKAAPSGNFTLTDLGSTNHTRLNGRRISSCELQDGDRILFGDTSAAYQSEIVPLAAAGQAPPPQAPSAPAASDIAPTAGAPATPPSRRPAIPSAAGRTRSRARSAAGAPRTSGGGGCLGVVIAAVLIAIACVAV